MGDHVAIPASLIEEIRNGQVIAFVGAGFSMGAGYPSWPQLLKRLLTHHLIEEIGNLHYIDLKVALQKANRLVYSQDVESELRVTMKEVYQLVSSIIDPGNSQMSNITECIPAEQCRSKLFDVVVEVTKNLLDSSKIGLVDEVQRLIQLGSGDSLDQAAQILEDEMHSDKLIAAIREILMPIPYDNLDQVTKSRIEMIRDIPFKAVMTTNFDTLLGFIRV